jgi:hypothetical protein
LVHNNPMDGWTSAVNVRVCNDGNVIRGNAIWGNTDEDPQLRESEGHGIIMDSCGEAGGALIENNLIWENEGWCITAYNSDGAVIRNNTCWLNGLGRQGGGGEVSVRGSYSSIHNNILVSKDGAPSLRIYGPSVDFESIESNHNIVWSPYHEDVMYWPPYYSGTLAEYQAQNPYGWDPDSLQVDPAVIDSGQRFLQLTEGSPAIDSGDDSNAPPEDYAGNSRPADGDGDGIARIDRGAFEYGGIFGDGFESGDLLSWTATAN